MYEIKNRSEILFLYDIQNANPNGDPNDENKPRIDEETGNNIVTDVRLKRTIRDYIQEQSKEYDIFVREVIYDKEGHIQDAKLRASDYLPEDKEQLKKMPAEEQKQYIAKMILEKCIDVRLFGATIPLDLKVDDGGKTKSVTSSITWTGPVQFKMGRSLHPVKIQHIKGTGAFASGDKSTKKTFREEYVVPYSLIAFHGVVNENAAKHTSLKAADIKLLKKAIWNGTKGLISRSKFGQMPRLLLFVNYKQPDFFIGDLDNLIGLKSNNDIRPEQLRKPEDYRIDMSQLLDQINKHKDKIEYIEYIADDRMSFVYDGKEIELKKLEMFIKISL
ncbi:MAG TPA: type I-B CRISPR-associated protein Cas7/Csh2 [Candidatus Marinimicrobia bacterium]|nr:type I-B CRISPR-associated protein Cas7/Csh2 [Candidatus Neomarinimicrobiota bacterium]